MNCILGLQYDHGDRRAEGRKGTPVDIGLGGFQWSRGESVDLFWDREHGAMLISGIVLAGFELELERLMVDGVTVGRDEMRLVDDSRYLLPHLLPVGADEIILCRVRVVVPFPRPALAAVVFGESLELPTSSQGGSS